MTDSYRPEHRGNGGPPPIPPAASSAMYHFQGSTNPPRAPRGYRPPTGPRFHPSSRNNYNNYGGISSRPLLRVRQDANDESFLQPNAVSKFRDVDKLTDSEEDEMSESDEESRPSKRIRTEVKDSASAAATPKWSNPDPYTALPPPPEATGKRTDVVKLIRKAKISDELDKEPSELAKNADFISFDTLDGGFDESLDEPTGLQPERPDHLGKRKRDQEDARPRPPRGYARSQKDAPVLREYQASGYISATPWLSHVSSSDSAAIA